MIFDAHRCLLITGHSWLMQAVGFGLCLALILRGASLFGVLELPWRRIAVLSTMLGLYIFTPPPDQWLAQMRCDGTLAFPVIELVQATGRGIVIGLQLRVHLLLIETLTASFESHLQLNSPSGPTAQGAFSALALSLWASHWWLYEGEALILLTETHLELSSSLIGGLLDSFLHALEHALWVAGSALLIIVAAELAFGFLQRGFPQLSLWQLTLPLRMVLALHILRSVLLQPFQQVV